MWPALVMDARMIFGEANRLRPSLLRNFMLFLFLKSCFLNTMYLKKLMDILTQIWKLRLNTKPKIGGIKWKYYKCEHRKLDRQKCQTHKCFKEKVLEFCSVLLKYSLELTSRYMNRYSPVLNAWGCFWSRIVISLLMKFMCSARNEQTHFNLDSRAWIYVFFCFVFVYLKQTCFGYCSLIRDMDLKKERYDNSSVWKESLME
jgi:hypothetical protein